MPTAAVRSHGWVASPVVQTLCTVQLKGLQAGCNITISTAPFASHGCMRVTLSAIWRSLLEHLWQQLRASLHLSHGLHTLPNVARPSPALRHCRPFAVAPALSAARAGADAADRGR